MTHPDIEATLGQLIGRQAWGTRLGFGSFLTIEFGCETAPSTVEDHARGEWHLWVYCTVWRIERAGDPQFASDALRSPALGPKTSDLLDYFWIDHGFECHGLRYFRHRNLLASAPPEGVRFAVARGSLSLSLYRRAARAGSDSAMLNIALMYREGEGLPRSPRNARAWLVKARRRGNARARQLLLSAPEP